MRLAAPIAIALLAALLAGCGGSSSGGSSSSTEAPPSGSTAPAGASAQSCPTSANGAEALRVTGVSCGNAERVVVAWQQGASCAPTAGASRSGCNAAGYRCLSTVTDRGLAVSCSGPGRSIAFIAKR
ncbi:MAG: hypothetical protein QOI84_1859 [Solirubrobacterales bacterium]|nr:hypothetical protein [Solirubrobacterales bacterium]